MSDKFATTSSSGGSKSLNLRSLRWERGISLEQCATAIGVDVRQLLVKESGRSPFTARERAELALILDLEPGQLDDMIERSGNRGLPDLAQAILAPKMHQ